MDFDYSQNEQDNIMSLKQRLRNLYLEDDDSNTKDSDHNWNQGSPSKENATDQETSNILSRDLVRKEKEEQKDFWLKKKALEDSEDSNSTPESISDEDDEPKNQLNKVPVSKLLSDEKNKNLLFYQNKMKSQPRGVYLEEMHEKCKSERWGDYDLLEDNHDYIQWLFPNYYRSDFNTSAYPLEKHEAEAFRTNKEIAKRLVKSYEMILDFYGMRLANHKTGRLERGEDYISRYQDALLENLHNHMRIRRILTHLNNVGFRKYAVELVNFLEREIYGEVGGFEKIFYQDGSFNNKASERAPLRKLARKSEPFYTWSFYGDHKNDPDKIKLLEKNCFGKYPDDFKESIYFLTL